MYPKKPTTAPLAPIASPVRFARVQQHPFFIPLTNDNTSDKGIKKDIADSGNPCLLKMPWVGLQKKLLLHQKISLLEKYT